MQHQVTGYSAISTIDWVETDVGAAAAAERHEIPAEMKYRIAMARQ